MKASTCIENVHRIARYPHRRHHGMSKQLTDTLIHMYNVHCTHSRWCRCCRWVGIHFTLYSISYIYVRYNVRDVRWINDSSSGHLKWFAFSERTIWLSNDRLRCENILLVGPKWHNSKVISTRMTAAFLLVMCAFFFICPALQLPIYLNCSLNRCVLCASHTWFYISRWVYVYVCVLVKCTAS